MENENELDSLIDALCDGTLDPAGMARLEQFVADDPMARKQMVLALQLDGHLRWEHGAGLGADERLSIDKEPSAEPLQLRIPLRRWMAVAAVFAMILGGVVALRVLEPPVPPQVDLALVEVQMADSSGEVREKAVVQFAQHAGIENAERVARVLKEDENRYVRAAAARGLGWMGATEQKPALYAALRDDAAVVRKAAIAAIDHLTDAWNAVAEDARQFVRVFREDESHEVRAAAARGLGGIGAYKEKKVLFEALGDRALSVRLAAVDAIDNIAGIRIELVGTTDSDRQATIVMLNQHWPSVERYYERQRASRAG